MQSQKGLLDRLTTEKAVARAVRHYSNARTRTGLGSGNDGRPPHILPPDYSALNEKIARKIARLGLKRGVKIRVAGGVLTVSRVKLDPPAVYAKGVRGSVNVLVIELAEQ